MRKLFVLTLVVVVVGFVASCGGNNAKDGQTETSATETTTAESGTENPSYDPNW